jgi:sugar/nucleoside kinase (ribokinase family)
LPQSGTTASKTSIDLVSEDSRRFTQIVPPALRHTDYCIINDFEAERLSGISIREQGKLICKNLKRIAAAIFDMGVKERGFPVTFTLAIQATAAGVNTPQSIGTITITEN